MPSVLLTVPHHKQIGTYNCLPACIRMVLHYHGELLAEDRLVQLLGTTPMGTPGSRLLRLQSPRWQVTYTPLTLPLIFDYLEKGLPVIALVQTIFLDYWQADLAHAVVIVGYDQDVIWLHDPAFIQAPQKASWDGFLAAWGSLIFLQASFREINDMPGRNFPELAG